MSREIKFRGICTAPGEFEGKWVYGDLLQKRAGTYITPQSQRIELKGGHLGRLIIMHEVDPETVGQYTGLKDRNGKEIYEGDIVQYKTMCSGAIGVVSFGEYEQDGSGGEYSEVTCLGWYINRKKVLLNERDIECGIDPEHYREEERQISPVQYGDMDIEVIGNIYEHPSLLGDTEAAAE